LRLLAGIVSAIKLIPEFHECLAALERQDGRPSRLSQASQARIRRVPAGDEDDLRRRPLSLQELDEVGVLGHDDDVGAAAAVKISWSNAR
jgi:hypothetical protein